MMLVMRLRLDPSSRAPVSQQLADALRARVRRGSLAPGSRLTPVRELAQELGLAANTVAKAYRALESEGLLEGRGRSGTFVVERPEGAHAEARLEVAAEAFAERARRLGFGPARIRSALERALRHR